MITRFRLTDFKGHRDTDLAFEPPLETLRVRGADTGLAAFLDEIGAILAPLLGR